MNDTSDEMQRMYHDLIMQKTDEERFLMGMSMCDTAKRIVLSSFPDGISETEKRIRLLNRYYSHDFSKEELNKITINSNRMTTQETTQETTRGKIIRLLKKNPHYTRDQLAVLTDRSDATVKEHLANLKKDGIRKRIGSTKTGYWEVKKEK